MGGGPALLEGLFRSPWDPNPRTLNLSQSPRSSSTQWSSLKILGGMGSVMGV